MRTAIHGSRVHLACFLTLIIMMQVGTATWADRGEVTYPDLRLLVAKVSAENLEGIEITAWARGYGEVLTAERRRLEKSPNPNSQGTMVVILNGCRADRTYVLSNATHVSLPVTPEPGTCDSLKTLTIHPAAQVKGELLPPEGDQLSNYGELAVVHCRDSSHEPRKILGVFPFAIEKLSPENIPDDQEVPPALGVWSAAIPAECVDLELNTGDFVQLNLRHPSLLALHTTPLGRHRLKYAAALLVRLTDADGVAIAKADLRLISAEELTSHISSSPGGAFRFAPPPSLSVAAVTAVTAVTDSEGWARLDNLAAGLFHLEVISAQRPAFYSEPIEIEPRLLTTLDPLRLPRGAELEVFLEGLDSGAAATIDQVTVQVFRADEDEKGLRGSRQAVIRLTDVAEEGAHSDPVDPHTDVSVPGRALFRQMTPGTWAARALAQVAGESFPILFGLSRVQLEPGIRQSLRLEYRFRRFHGRVTLEGDGAAARGYISCDIPDCMASSPKINTDEEGRFTLLLEHPGPYTANIRLDPGSDRSASVSGLRFDDPDEEVEIAVDALVLKAFVEGEVTYASGEPAVGVYVKAHGLPSGERRRGPVGLAPGTTMTDDFGFFEFRGLSPGEWRITVREGELSAGLTIQLEGKERRSIQLVMENKVNWTASVVGGSHPVSGAQGQVTPVQANGVLFQESFQADENGHFELRSPPTPGGLVNVALEPTASTPAAALRVIATDDMLIEAPRQGGAVRLVVVDRSAPPIDFPSGVLLADDGAWLPLSLARVQPVRAATGFSVTALEMPHLSVGHWRLVIAPSFGHLSALASGQVAALPVLAEFTVVTGQLIEVVLGSPNPSDDREGDEP